MRFALANVAKGGGVENVSYYRDITCKFMGIQNIHAMRASQTKFMEACYSQSDKNWFKMIHESQWLLHLRLLLLAAKEVAEQASQPSVSFITPTRCPIFTTALIGFSSV
nr:unnamed protein product [Spirometra erinaceieuropaei]